MSIEVYRKKTLTAFPKAMLSQIDELAQIEHRTRSDLIREALRRYLANAKSQYAYVPTQSCETGRV